MRLVQIHTEDDLYLEGLIAESENKGTIIIHIHGMQGDFYANFSPYFRGYPGKGISFLAGEHRGSFVAKTFPTSEGGRLIGGAYEIFEESVHDIKAWIDFAQNEGYQNIWLSSHSLAPAKVAYYMYTTKDDRVKGLIFLSPSDNVGLVKDPEGAIDHAICFPEAERLIREGKGDQLLSHRLWGDKVLSATTYYNLFSDDALSNIFHYYDLARSWEAVQSIRIPVIAFTGTNDDGIIPVMPAQEAMDVLRGELINCPKVEAIVFDGADHSFTGFEEHIISLSSTFISEVS